eukprot:gene3541-5794_t
MPDTLYPQGFIDQVPLTQMSVTAPPGRTHLYYTGKPEFEFGDGLSYDDWELGWHGTPPTTAELTTDASASASFALMVQNKGTYGGGVTVL